MRRTIKLLFKSLLGLAALLLLVLAAWVASNGRWADAAPQPVPAELALRPVSAAAVDNAFFDLQGLDAADGADINAVGQASLQGVAHAGDTRLRWPQGEPWQCNSRKRDCVRLWLDQAAALRAAMAQAEALGARCERIAGMAALQEVWPQRSAGGPLQQQPFSALPTPRFTGLTACTRWLGMQAALAPDAAAAMAWLTQADALARRALAGSRSLIGTMIGLAAVQNNWVLAADLVVNRGLDRALLLPLLAPLPPDVLSPRHWVPHEAQFGRETMRDMVDTGRGCPGATDADDRPLAHWLALQWCRTALGVMPEQSAQDSDAQWLRRLAVLPAAGPANCELLAAHWRQPASPWPAWRNTFTRAIIGTPHWLPYAARQTDLELLRLTLLAKVDGQALPAAVQLGAQAGGLRFTGCGARLASDEAQGGLRLPAL